MAPRALPSRTAAFDTCLRTEPGLPHVRNFGIENARSDLIAYLDHDDLWAANKLSRQVACMTERPDLLYSITNVRFFLEPGSTLRPGFKRESFEVGQAGCTAGALLAKREAFRQIGMFDPDLPVGCDQDWFARARDAQLPMHSIPEPLLYKRIHNTNLSSDVHTSGKDLLTTVARSRQRCVRSE